MSGFEQEIAQWLSQFAYRPYELYLIIVLLMTASSFGLPFPEEIVLVSVGVIAYTGTRPDLYPPPYAGAAVVDPYVAAVVCFLAVFLSDFLVFGIGRYFGQSILNSKRVAKWISPEQSKKLQIISNRYGSWACGVFRFTPGLRFPGHLSCGIVGISPLTFTAIDGTAALLSVPTQVLLVAHFGEPVLKNLKDFKIALFSGLGAIALGYVLYRTFTWYQKRRAAVKAAQPTAKIIPFPQRPAAKANQASPQENQRQSTNKQ